MSGGSTVREVQPGTGPPSPSSNGNNGATLKPWKELSPGEKKEKVLDTSYAWVVRPLCLISTISSVLSCLLSNIVDKENEYLDNIAEYFNKGAYFINGIYGAFENAASNCLPGGIGYGLVSLASVIGTKENMYLLKGWGTILDQMPAMLDDVGTNPKLLEIQNSKNRSGEDFNKYSSLWESVTKTWDAIKVVCGDIYKEAKSKLLKGKIIGFLKIFILKDERRAEKNLVVSSLGVLAGVTIALVNKFKLVGASLRDIFGMHADLGLFSKKNPWYKACGAFYIIGSSTDLIYRWTDIPKLELAAVGMDNLGFMFMTWANKNVNRDVKNKSNGNGNGNGTH